MIVQLSRWRLAYLQFFALQSIHIVLFSLLQNGEPQGTLLAASGVVNVIVYLRLLLSDMKYSGEDINPLWFYVGMSILRLGVGTIYVGSLVWTDNLWLAKLGRIDASEWLMQGHLLLICGEFLFILGTYAFRSIRVSADKKKKPIPRHSASRTYKAGLFSGYFAPYWIITLWMLFAMTLNVSMR